MVSGASYLFYLMPRADPASLVSTPNENLFDMVAKYRAGTGQPVGRAANMAVRATRWRFPIMPTCRQIIYVGVHLLRPKYD